MTVEYRFIEESLEDIEGFSESIQRGIFEKVDDAAADYFYNSEYYSKFYDHHGRVWDKLNFEIEDQSIRAVFIEQDEFLVIFVGNHEDFDYDTELYTLLQSRSK